jgi:hypothetical protein
MKKITIMIAALLATGLAWSQDEGPQRKATGYTKDGALFYQVSGCVPQSMLEIYSTPSGGSLVATARADEQGNALVEVPKGKSYAFAMNRTRATKGGDAGAGYYIALGQPVLSVQSVTAEDGQLRWQVSGQDAGVSCQVLGSDGTNATLQRRDASGGSYSYSGATPGTDQYSVQLTDAASGLRISLGKAVLAKPGAVRVGPTVFSDVLNVQLLTVPSGTLQLYNGNGALVHSTAVRQGLNAVNLSTVAPAGYVVRVLDRNSRTVFTGRVTKGQ